MIRGVYLNGMVDDWSECLKIRQFVFEEAYHCKADIDEFDDTALHLLLFDENENPVATVRLMFDMDGIFKFDYLSVLSQSRHCGYADFLMHMVFDKANQCGALFLESSDIIHAPDYFKKYGFVINHDKLCLNLNDYFNTHRCCH